MYCVGAVSRSLNDVFRSGYSLRSAMNHKQKLVYLDGSFIIHNAIHILRRRSTFRGHWKPS